MNRTRRNGIKRVLRMLVTVIDEIKDVREDFALYVREEEDVIDNYPESFRYSDKFSEIEDTFERLSDIMYRFDDYVDGLESIVEDTRRCIGDVD